MVSQKVCSFVWLAVKTIKMIWNLQCMLKINCWHLVNSFLFSSLRYLMGMFKSSKWRLYLKTMCTTQFFSLLVGNSVCLRVSTKPLRWCCIVYKKDKPERFTPHSTGRSVIELKKPAFGFRLFLQRMRKIEECGKSLFYDSNES